MLESLKDYAMQVHDPVVRVPMTSRVTWHSSVNEAINGADILIIMTPWENFKTLTPSVLKKYMDGKTIIDPHCSLNEETFVNAGFQYFTMGKGELC